MQNELKDHVIRWVDNMSDAVERIEINTEPSTAKRHQAITDLYQYSRLISKVMTGEVRFIGHPLTRETLNEKTDT